MKHNDLQQVLEDHALTSRSMKLKTLILDFIGALALMVILFGVPIVSWVLFG